jgi:hypothetical protein
MYPLTDLRLARIVASPQVVQFFRILRLCNCMDAAIGRDVSRQNGIYYPGSIPDLSSSSATPLKSSSSNLAREGTPVSRSQPLNW